MAATAVSGGTPRLSHRQLVQQLDGAMQVPGGSFALLLLTLADLPGLQARIGSEVSGVLVERLAEQIQSALAGRSTVLRFGDAAVCILISAIRNAGHAKLAGEKLVRIAEDVMNDPALMIAPEMNIGIALYPRQASDAESLLRKAQLAAAAARKRAARMQIFDDNCVEQVLTPWKLGGAFAEALRTGGLQVYYQPKVRIADRQTAGVEALMRWSTDGKVIANPDVFIPLAEQADLIQDTTWYTLSNSLQQAATHDNLPVAVNITPGMLHHGDFAEMIRTAVSTWNVPRGGLTLEITEGALISDFEQAMARLNQVRELGVRVSIDDFGTGYSSLSYFKKITADEIKIDKSFVLHMLKEEADRRLVEAILGLARQFSFATVAEGVEDEATLSMLAGMGCDYAQGFLFAPALDSEQLKQWLQRNSHA
jgi:EAL domain-containing protein (putative c-di-GMP-specific phosphodiesterase class I)/GGDEF domain-containing protein